VLGHPDILRKFNIAMKQDDLNKCCSVQKAHKGEIEGVQYELFEMAPEVFSIIRKIQNVSEELISKAFSPLNIDNISIGVSQNKGGCFFIKPEQGGLIIQSIHKKSYKRMIKFLPEYYKYILMNPNTHLIPILGVYQLTITQNKNSLPIYFLI
jgi:hypothetical protein